MSAPLSAATFQVILWSGGVLMTQTTMQGRKALLTVQDWRSRSPIHRAQMVPTQPLPDHTTVTAKLVHIARALGYAMENAANFNGVQPENTFTMPGLANGDPNTHKVFVTTVTDIITTRTHRQRKRHTLRLMTHDEARAALEMGE